MPKPKVLISSFTSNGSSYALLKVEQYFSDEPSWHQLQHCEVCESTASSAMTMRLICQADLVQDLYIKELRSYKPPAMKSSDAEGHVQKFMLPKAPLSPEEHDIASELKAYEDQKVDVEGQAAEDEEVAERDVSSQR